MDDAQHQLETLLQLENLHADLFNQLDQLERRVAEVLAEFQPTAKRGSSQAPSPAEIPASSEPQLVQPAKAA